MNALQVVDATAKNLELLRITFNTLQQIVQMEQKQGRGVNMCEAFTVAAAAKIVYEYWEKEKRKVPSSIGDKICSKEFIHVPFSMPKEMQNEIAKEIHNSTWFKTVWPNIKRG